MPAEKISLFPKSVFICIFLSFLLLSTIFAQEENKEKEKKHKTLTEEIVVEAKRPKDTPLATTSLIARERIELTFSKELSEVLPFSTGTHISTGSKNEFRLNIRGLSSQRIALLYDGIPIYEPFFNSFDLKTITAEEVESIKVIKGASSVLYGPNAMGGVVNIITRRPNSPSFSLRSSYDSNSTSYVSSHTALTWKKIFFTGFASYEKSDGYKWKKNGERVLRANSDYERKNFTGKIYFYPYQKSEILLEAAYYSSEYGIPSATEIFRPRFWRFKDWNRVQLNLGGTFPFWRGGTLKVRSYYVRHDNILDAFRDEGMEELRWESTFKNDSWGAFVLGSIPFRSRDEWKFSLNLRQDKAQTQDDIGQGWDVFEHRTISLGAENHLNLNQEWKLIAGASLDYLKKQTGENKSSLNPILGLKFTPREHLDFHLSLAQKSRFPSMRALYSTTTGNPDLRDERGTNYELGFTYNKNMALSGAVFYNRIRDLINVILLPDGTKSNFNIGRADILGLEVEFRTALRWSNLAVNYTYLKGENKQENRPLELLPSSQINFTLDLRLMDTLKFSLWGLGVSDSEVKVGDDIIDIPGYIVLNGILTKSFPQFSIFLKVENLFDKYHFTEPGFPMKARTIAAGLKLGLGQKTD